MNCYVQFLTLAFNQSKESGECESLRAFARKIGISPSTLIRVLKKERALPLTAAHIIVKALNLSSAESDHFLSLVLKQKLNTDKLKRKEDGFSFKGTLEENSHQNIILDHDALNVLALFQTQHPKTIESVVSLLGLSMSRAEVVLKKLFCARLIKIKEGRFENTLENYSTTDNIKSELIRQSHLNLLEISKLKLQSLAVEQRDFTSLKIACSKNGLDKAKKEIRKFQKKIFDILNSEENKTEVVELAIQLFPHTHFGRGI